MVMAKSTPTPEMIMTFREQQKLLNELLADRSLSRLLRQDWPRTPEELEERRRA